MHRNARHGFTLLELLVALAIFTIAMAIIVGTFTATISAWRKGSDMLDRLHQGDFVMEQLVSALRSCAYFTTRPEKYGFHHKSQSGGEFPADEISWVASGTAFIPNDSIFANGLYRLTVTIDDDEEGEPAVAITVTPHLAEEGDYEAETWYVSRIVKGIDCRVYNEEDEYWEDRWEDTNSVPRLVEVALYMEPIEDHDDPVVIKRLVEIPVAPELAGPAKFGGPEGTEREP